MHASEQFCILARAPGRPSAPWRARPLAGLACVLALSLAACGGSDAEPTGAVSGNGNALAGAVPAAGGAASASSPGSPVGLPSAGQTGSPAGSQAGNEPDDQPDGNTGPRYEVTLTNLTAGQPLSPMALLLHREGWQLFGIGEPASVALEQLAEGAATDPLIALARSDAAHATDAVIGAGPIGPGQSASATLSVAQGDATGLRLSGATMLVNTNDAIAAVNGRALSSLAVNDSMVIGLSGYDTGTEANDELASHMPGPAGGGSGEGFNPLRDDIADRVHVHPGPVSADDGLSGSALREVHRWNHPVARLTIARVR